MIVLTEPQLREIVLEASVAYANELATASIQEAEIARDRVLRLTLQKFGQTLTPPCVIPCS